jgi:hypothetical protein
MADDYFENETFSHFTSMDDSGGISEPDSPLNSTESLGEDSYRLSSSFSLSNSRSFTESGSESESDAEGIPNPDELESQIGSQNPIKFVILMKNQRMMMTMMLKVCNLCTPSFAILFSFETHIISSTANHNHRKFSFQGYHQKFHQMMKMI